MATSDAPLLVLNCGNTRVSAAVFLSDGEEYLHLHSVVSEQLEYDFTKEDDWLEALGEAVRNLKKKAKLPSKGNFILPGNKFLTKQLQVPHVEKSKQRQIIAVEAKQSIPHLFGQLEWDGQVLHDDGVEADVLFLASKREDLKEFYDRMKAAGIAPIGIAASPVLDFNTFRHTYQDFEEDCMLLNIGARTSNLLFVSKDGLLARSINLGGNVLTQHISEHLGIPFQEAEKKKVGYCMGTLPLPDDDPFVVVLEEHREKYLKRLNQELTRSIVAYRNQRKKQPPSFLLISGKGSLLYGLPEYLGEMQHLEIHHLDPLGNVSVDESISEDDLNLLYYELSESVGEAARLAFGDKIDAVGVNLLPNSIQTKVTSNKQMPWYLAASLLTCAAPVFPYFKIKEQVADYESRISSLNTEIRNAGKWEKTIQKYEELCFDEYQKIQKLEGLVNSKYNWIIFFQDIQESMLEVKDVWLEDLTIDRQERREYVASDNPNEGNVLVIHKDNTVKLTGRLLLRPKEGEAEVTQETIDKYVSQNVIQLKDSIENSEFVMPGTKYQINYDNIDKKILSFTFDLKINPEKPL